MAGNTPRVEVSRRSALKLLGAVAALAVADPTKLLPAAAPEVAPLLCGTANWASWKIQIQISNQLLADSTPYFSNAANRALREDFDRAVDRLYLTGAQGY